MKGLDVQKYRSYVDGFDLSNEEKDKLLEAIWLLLETFVDRSFDEDPVQYLLGRDAESNRKSRKNVVDSACKRTE